MQATVYPSHCGGSLGQEEKECVSMAGSSHVTSSVTVRIRTES